MTFLKEQLDCINAAKSRLAHITKGLKTCVTMIPNTWLRLEKIKIENI
jgi:hypothetical protein